MVRRGNLIRVAPLTTLEKERELRDRAAASSRSSSRRSRRGSSRSATRARRISSRACSELLSPRGTVSVDERTNVLIVRDVVENLDDVEELVRTPRHADAAGARRGAHRRGDEPVPRATSASSGAATSRSNSATGNPTGLVFPSNVGIAGGNYDNNTPTQGLSPFVARIPTPNFAVNLPATIGTGQGGALGLTLGSVGGNVQHQRAPVRGRGHRHAAHHQLAAHPHARQLRGAHRAGHARSRTRRSARRACRPRSRRRSSSSRCART